MASEDHKQLSQYLKEVHSNLRKSCAKLGAEKAWLEHCQDKDMLSLYAQSMKKLATTHWENHCVGESCVNTSRIKWTVNLCYDYFIKNNYENWYEKEKAISHKINTFMETKEHFSDPLKLIDVGSCYNPFKIYDIFDVFAIDLCPANDSVLQCDFLTVPIGSYTIARDNKVTQIQQACFDIVTFCFVLEYIPTSELRVSACEKAYSILKPGGLLIINTPDSKHVGANCKIMKCWRYTLARMGFSRIKYEKFKHMHSMAFRKALHQIIAERWATLHKETYMEYSLHIPQDYQKIEDKFFEKDSRAELSTEDFKEMPFYNETKF